MINESRRIKLRKPRRLTTALRGGPVRAKVRRKSLRRICAPRLGDGILMAQFEIEFHRNSIARPKPASGQTGSNIAAPATRHVSAGPVFLGNFAPFRRRCLYGPGQGMVSAYSEAHLSVAQSVPVNTKYYWACQEHYPIRHHFGSDWSVRAYGTQSLVRPWCWPSMLPVNIQSQLWVKISRSSRFTNVSS